jgi:Holliday junction resolvasome RuvABC endonuclease subunit
VGIAVFEDTELVDWRVLTFPGPWTQRKRNYLTSGLQRVFATYGVLKVAVKVPDITPTSKGYAQVLGVLNVLCERRNIPVSYHMLSVLKQVLLKDSTATKEHIAQILTEKYPELLPELQKRKRNYNYYIKIFEAVAVGHLYINNRS